MIWTPIFINVLYTVTFQQKIMFYMNFCNGLRIKYFMNYVYLRKCMFRPRGFFLCRCISDYCFNFFFRGQRASSRRSIKAHHFKNGSWGNIARVEEKGNAARAMRSFLKQRWRLTRKVKNGNTSENPKYLNRLNKHTSDSNVSQSCAGKIC